METTYEIYALRYATMSPRTPNMNYITPDPHETAASDLDYFVWLVRGGGRNILVDTGFNAEEAAVRSRKLTLNPAEALTRFGVFAVNVLAADQREVAERCGARRGRWLEERRALGHVSDHAAQVGAGTLVQNLDQECVQLLFYRL